MNSLRRNNWGFIGLATEWRLLYGSLLALYATFMTGSRTAWLVCLGLTALFSLFAWYFSLQRLRAVNGTPKSNVASAAQGYVELEGRGRTYGDPPLASKLTGLPCLWYRYRVDERISRREWRTIDSGESSSSFLLDDGSGVCVVDPAGAEIQTSHQDTWFDPVYRYTEWTLIGNDRIYVSGYFNTVGGSSVDETLGDEVKKVVSEWKLDMPNLRKQFDLNNDGAFDDREWMLVRHAARREAEKRLNAERAEPDMNAVAQPRDGRLFLISNLNKSSLARRYLLLAWMHIVILFGSLCGLAWM